jgi:hypothetical protein
MRYVILESPQSGYRVWLPLELTTSRELSMRDIGRNGGKFLSAFVTPYPAPCSFSQLARQVKFKPNHTVTTIQTSVPLLQIQIEAKI